MKRLLGFLLAAITIGLFAGCSDNSVSPSSSFTATLTANKSTYTLNESILLTAASSATNPTYYWKEGGDPTDLVNGWDQGTQTKTFNKSSAGTYTFHVQVWTSTGTKVASVTVTVSSSTISLSSSKSYYKPNEAISLTASCSEAGATYFWSESATGPWTQGTSTQTYTKAAEQVYTFYVKAVVPGKSDLIASTTVTVSSQDNPYVLHTNITASTFWVGEGASDANGGISNVGSAWDSKWGTHFGLVDAPTIARDADFIPTSPEYKGTENPYYFALPYNDYDPVAYDGADCNAYVSAAGRSDLSVIYDADYGRNIVVTSSVQSSGYDKIKSSTSRIPWISSENWSGKSRVKARWIKITKNGKDCYAQWGDAGPYYYDDYDYVFGSATPMNQKVAKDSPNAGLDVSPSVMLYLGVRLWDQGTSEGGFSWQFVDFAQVPDGPWKKHISTNTLSW